MPTWGQSLRCLVPNSWGQDTWGNEDEVAMTHPKSWYQTFWTGQGIGIGALNGYQTDEKLYQESLCQRGLRYLRSCGSLGTLEYDRLNLEFVSEYMIFMEGWRDVQDPPIALPLNSSTCLRVAILVHLCITYLLGISWHSSALRTTMMWEQRMPIDSNNLQEHVVVNFPYPAHTIPTSCDLFLPNLFHMQSLWTVFGKTSSCWGVTISLGASPSIAFKQFLNSHLYDSLFSFDKKAAPNVIHDLWWFVPSSL